MTTEQLAMLERNVVQNHVPFSLSLLRAIIGPDVSLVAEVMEGRMPEPWRSLVVERLDRISIIEYQLGKVQEQLNRIEAKLSQ